MCYIIVVGDMNAKSPLWNSPLTDDKAEIFDDLIQQHNRRSTIKKSFRRR